MLDQRSARIETDCRANAGMIFVPCAKGISRSPAEYGKPEDLAAGARFLAATLA